MTVSQDHLDAVSQFQSLRRREMLQMWAHGDIWGTGSRAPQGGARGDTYRTYAHHDASTPEGIKAFFHNAQVKHFMSCYVLILNCMVGC